MASQVRGDFRLPYGAQLLLLLREVVVLLLQQELLLLLQLVVVPDLMLELLLAD